MPGHCNDSYVYSFLTHKCTSPVSLESVLPQSHNIHDICLLIQLKGTKAALMTDAYCNKSFIP